MNLEFILACSDLGVHVNGSKNGPITIYEEIKKDFINSTCTIIETKKDIIKSVDYLDKAKNLDAVNEFNKNLFNDVTHSLNSGKFPLILGGDHSIAIGSALASLNYYKNLGIIWIDSHGDYHNFDTTPSGNIHGLPFAAITGFKKTEAITKHISSSFFNPKNAVLVGARDMEDEEIVNLKEAGVTIFTTEDLKKYGINNIMTKAIEIASNETNGIHISYDVDVIDPEIAMGVSVPAIDGITENEAIQIIDILVQNKEKIKSLDLVEYNPELDKNNLTLEIAKNIVYKFIKGQES